MRLLGVDFPDAGIDDGSVLLRPAVYADVPAVINACADPSIRRYNSAPASKVEGRAWVDGATDGRPSSRAVRLAIADLLSGSLLGSLGVPVVDLDAQRLEVGYWLVPTARGRGVATKALGLFCAWAFSELSLARIEALPEVENRASQRVLERVGFQREGVLRSFQEVRGRRRDMVMYSLLPEDLP